MIISNMDLQFGGKARKWVSHYALLLVMNMVDIL